MKKELIVEEMKASEKGSILVKNLNQDKIKLVKNSKGYGWEVSVCFEDYKDGIDKLSCIDGMLKNVWGTMGGIEKDE